nr:SDR family oxidoreductase [Microvirga puerhi]
MITGIGRGIGRALARVLLTRGDRVIGTVRDRAQLPADWQGFQETGHLKIVRLDILDEKSIADAARSVDEAIDVLVNNSGVIGPKRQSTLDMDFDGFLDTLKVNTLGPLHIVQAFLPHLRKAEHPKILTISSRMGSMAYAKSDRIAYRASKAAVNKVVQGLSTDLAPEGMIVVSVHPGWVRTDMGGTGADISVEQSAAGIVALSDRLSASDSGRFFDWQGEELPF